MMAAKYRKTDLLCFLRLKSLLLVKRFDTKKAGIGKKINDE